ncbi:hypothetical protein SIN8267_03452 [Sinobacterium norvegicum]|uniref:AAA domain-containing protein n=1 Tax=Sinobacterium norvegicum TaxID=1641715 RepID=A0ABM9AKK7_9GAMM|nr:CpsD/CapB family tyrosine-protein kinase [Sinobacterium norvegicum]CAH0993304.1 hypothetical protein SIN8267_03452 [Sinobacterium norvegicum]
MEYVQEAIAKARKKRHEIDGSAEAKNKADAISDLTEIKYTKTPVHNLSLLHLEKNRVVTAFSNDVRAEPYRQLRTILLKEFRERKVNNLAIVSADNSAGKTLTAINLAIALSKEVNQTVLLVDLDLQSPSVASTLGLEIEYGISDLLNNEVSVDKVLINPGLERLVILPAKKVEGNTSEILSSPRMRSLMQEIEQRYPERIVIYDLPPLLNDDDALVIAERVGSTLLVIEEGRTTPENLERSLLLLDKTSLIGTILNKAHI